MTLLARRVLSETAFNFRAGLAANHQKPKNTVPKGFSESFAAEEEGKEKEPTPLSQLFSSAYSWYTYRYRNKTNLILEIEAWRVLVFFAY